MKEIFGNREGSIVGHYRSILDRAGIPCFVRNEQLQASMQQDWWCLRCGETVPARFDFCWNCEHD